MTKTIKNYIDKHWMIFVVRGSLAIIFGSLIMFSGAMKIENIIAVVGVFLLFMGIIDTVGALYNSTKQHGWINSIIDALVDVMAALALMFFAKDSLVTSLVIISVYTIVSGLIDIFHGFLSTIDPTDRFIRILAGACGCVMGIVIINAGSFEIMTFARFFGAYMLIVGVTSTIYGVHNRVQDVEYKKLTKKQTHKSTKKKNK